MKLFCPVLHAQYLATVEKLKNGGELSPLEKQLVATHLKKPNWPVPFAHTFATLQIHGEIDDFDLLIIRAASHGVRMRLGMPKIMHPGAVRAVIMTKLWHKYYADIMKRKENTTKFDLDDLEMATWDRINHEVHPDLALAEAKRERALPLTHFEEVLLEEHKGDALSARQIAKSAVVLRLRAS